MHSQYCPPHLRLDLSVGLLPSYVCNKVLYAPLLYPARYGFPAVFILLGLITRIIFREEYSVNKEQKKAFGHEEDDNRIR
jgi:hypothetical protein